MNKKILLCSILLVVILILVLFPTTISEKINPKIEPLDNGEIEIISQISGMCISYTSKGFFLIHRQFEIEEYYIVSMHIKAYTLNRSEPVYYANPTEYFYAPLFIGWGIGLATDRIQIGGIAFGNIKWS